MPRPGPRRPTITIRMSEQGLHAVDELALDEGLVKGSGEPNRSEMIRLLCACGLKHWRKGWRP